MRLCVYEGIEQFVVRKSKWENVLKGVSAYIATCILTQSSRYCCLPAGLCCFQCPLRGYACLRLHLQLQHIPASNPLMYEFTYTQTQTQTHARTYDSSLVDTDAVFAIKQKHGSMARGSVPSIHVDLMCVCSWHPTTGKNRLPPFLSLVLKNIT